MIPSKVKLISGAALLAAVFASGWYVNGLIWQNRSDELLKEQKNLLISQCNDQKKITEEASHEYQKKLRAANDRLAHLKRLHANTCLPIARPSDGSNGAAAAVDTRSNGLAAAPLLDLAAECDGYRAQLIGLQDFINRVWDSQ
jgi:hypothetical protein